MKWVPLTPEKSQKSSAESLGNVSHAEMSWSSYLVRAICVIALALFPMVFVKTVAAHPGVDPDIHEITDELEKNPTSVDLLIKRGQLYRSNKDLINSLHDLDQAKQFDGGNPEVMFQRGLTLSALGRDVEAEVVLDQFLERDTLLGNGQDIPSGQKTRKNVIAMAERAHIRARTGRSNLALTDYSSAIRRLPVVGLYMARGQLQENLGKLAEAAAGYREGLSHLPHAIALKKNLIKIEIARTQFNQALLLIDEELARASTKTSWYLLRGEVLATMGHAEAAKAAREQALAAVNQIMTKRVTAIHRLSRAKVFMALGRVDEAKSDLLLAMEMAPRLEGARDLLKQLEGN